jgi:G3E family GTPase
VREFARLDGVVTLVDAKHIEQHLDEKKAKGAVNESVQQVAFADRLLLNKVDLVNGEKALQRVEARLREINPFAPIQRCSRSAVEVSSVLGIHGFDLQRTLTLDPTFLDVTKPATKHDAAVGSHSIDQGAPRHLRKVRKGELDLQLVQQWIGDLLEERGEDIYRMKGVVSCPRPCLPASVPPCSHAPMPEGLLPRSKLLSPALLARRSPRQLAIAHAKQRFVFHAVHMVMDGTFDAEWEEGEPRESKLVFIGKNLDAAELDANFDACLDSPELRASRLASLRFGVGDTVECNLGDEGWESGVVVKTMHRDDAVPPGQVAPYQVRLRLSGELIFAPCDDDEVVRAPRRRSTRLRDLGSGVGIAEAEHGHSHGHSHDHSHDHSHGHGHGHEHDEDECTDPSHDHHHSKHEEQPTHDHDHAQPDAKHKAAKRSRRH